MSNLYEESQKIKSLMKEKKHEEAFQHFKSIYKSYPKEEIAKNEYVVADIITCLKKTKRFHEADNYLKYLSIRIETDTPVRILNSYGWLLFDKLKEDHSENDVIHEDDIIDETIEDEVKQAINNNYEKEIISEEIARLLPLVAKQSQYSPFSKLFSSVLKKEKQKLNPNWQFINELLGRLKPDELGTICESFNTKIKGKEKSIELASDKEIWYAYKTKALLKLGKYQECFDLCTAALLLFEKFHYGNNVWIARRIALCKKELGDPESAIKELTSILKKKNEWFLQAELSVLYYEKQDLTEALNYGTLAALNHGDPEFKIGLYFHLGNIFTKMNQFETAYEHYYLVKLIREEMGWKITSILNDALNSNPNQKEINKNAGQLLDQLKSIWQSYQPTDIPIQNVKTKGLLGQISNINIEKGFGFIKGDNNDYHFIINQLNFDVSNLKMGTKVSFDSKPPKVEGKNPNAINIKIIT